jgi:hypothetical protein
VRNFRYGIHTDGILFDLATHASFSSRILRELAHWGSECVNFAAHNERIFGVPTHTFLDALGVRLPRQHMFLPHMVSLITPSILCGDAGGTHLPRLAPLLEL